MVAICCYFWRNFFEMRRIVIVIIWSCFALQLFGQDAKVLLLIDVQEFYFPGGALPLHQPVEAATRASEVLARFRDQGWAVVHVRHDFEPGGAIHALVAPIEGEVVITKKEVNAFVGTRLLEELKSLGAKELVLAGMQTHMCLEAAVRAAKDLGFRCTVIADACASRDLSFDGIAIPAAHVHASTLATLSRNYARVVKTAEWLMEAETK